LIGRVLPNCSSAAKRYIVTFISIHIPPEQMIGAKPTVLPVRDSRFQSNHRPHVLYRPVKYVLSTTRPDRTKTVTSCSPGGCTDKIVVTMNSPHSRYPHLFAIIRLDLPFDEENPFNSISVVKAFSDVEEAETEAERLRSVNGPSKCLYRVQTTHLITRTGA